MATYLLLRDNKQTGPYTFDELKVKGLKAYDLVWVEGKSAAWRYPGEVEELKPFSPEVVEQPFDRFYRKPAAEIKPVANNPVKQNPVVAEKELAHAAAPQQAVIEIGNKNIYVTLPASRKNTPVKEVVTADETARKETVYYKEPVKQDFVRQIIPQVSTTTVEESFYKPQEESNYSISNNKSTTSAPSNQDIFQTWKKPVLAVAAVLILLGTGIFIGLYISRPVANLSSINSVNTTKESSVNANQASVPTAAIPVSTKLPEQKTEDIFQDNSKPVSAENSIQADKKLTAPPVEKKKSTTIKDKTDPAQKLPVAVNSNADSINAAALQAASQHREATHRDDAAVTDKDAAKTNLASLVSVGAGKYNVGTFGGISELQLTVNNRSAHPLELVVVEVQYVQANKKIFKTENIYFRNINAGAALMQEAPKSPRGIKVQYRITLINSKESGLSYSAL